jgi:RNA-directed DNA polymerase
MKTYTNIYPEVYNLSNLILAWRKARKGKTKKIYVIEFEENLGDNLRELKFELMSQIYKPEPLKTFILRDPKTRKISKSAFRDRIVHHALIRIIEPIFDKGFIYDSCANRIGKGNLFALKRFDLFKRKVTCNLRREAFCFKADIKHYFQEVNHEVIIGLIRRKIKDEKVILLIERILENGANGWGRTKFCKKGMPLGNLTSQFFANVYLNELDYFVKHELKAKYYIRYVDDFVILHESKKQLEIWKPKIKKFLIDRLRIELHPDKSKIISLSRGVDFVGFRNFYHHRLLRTKNIRSILNKVERYKKEEMSKEKILESSQGWNAYAKWANSFKLRKEIETLILAGFPLTSPMHR